MSDRCVFFFQAEDGIRDLVRSRGLGDVYKRQPVSEARSGRPAVSRDSDALQHRPAPGGFADIQCLSLIHI